MNKKMSMMLMMIGIVLLIVVSFSYSFGTWDLPKIAYMTLWLACIGILRFGASFGLQLER